MTVILLVEDEPDILETLEMVLKMEGYEVVTAPNGKIGLERLKEQMPDLIVSDIMMPVLTGLEMLREIRSNPKYKEIPVLLMSAGGLTVKKEDYQWTEFLSKPFCLDHFLEVVARNSRKAAA